MKVKLKSFKQTEIRNDYSGPSTAKKKKVDSWPEFSISSSQLDGLGKLTLNQECRLVVEAEVISLKQPDDWEKDRGEGKGEIIARFRMKAGAISKQEPKSIAEASDRMREGKGY